MLLNSLSPGRTLELGIFAKILARPSVDELFDAIAGYGLTCTEWNWACLPGLSSLPSAVPYETTRSVVRAAARSGVRISAISAPFNLIQPLAREHGLERLPALAEAATAVGSDLLVLCTGTRHPTDLWAYHAGNSSRKAWREMISGLGRASSIARCYGVRLAIVPDSAHVISDVASAERALDELGPDSEFLSIALSADVLFPPTMDAQEYPEAIEDALARLGEYVSLARATGTSNIDRAMPYASYITALVETPAISAAAKHGKRLPLILHGMSEDEVRAAAALLRESIDVLDRSWQARLLAEFMPR
jgi:hypothetical protein